MINESITNYYYYYYHHHHCWQWRRQLVGTWARATLAFENFFSLYVETSLVWFGTMPNSKSPLGYSFRRIRFGMI